MRFEGVGIIGDKTMKPTMTWDWKDRTDPKTGKTRKVKVPFIRFSMFVEDLTKRSIFNQETGYSNRPREIIQVVLPESDRGKNLFPSLSPGRLVLIKGRLTFSPSVAKNNNGEEQVYVNAKVYMDDLQFMDSPVERIVERTIGLMTKSGVKINGQEITDKTANEIQESISQYLAVQREPNGPPREEIDKTGSQSSSSGQSQSSDPDVPEFAQ
jgi:single-stranded DNA-binding protein